MNRYIYRRVGRGFFKLSGSEEGGIKDPEKIPLPNRAVQDEPGKAGVCEEPERKALKELLKGQGGNKHE